ncbi:hypothetical protein J6497_39390 [Bradyrhizobium sp. CNPSo 4026]|nr:hypothetical protein [Bradyrhizobium cenepequi]
MSPQLRWSGPNVPIDLTISCVAKCGSRTATRDGAASRAPAALSPNWAWRCKIRILEFDEFARA